MSELEKHLERAEKYANKGKFADAIAEYAAAFKLAPQSLDLLRNMADLCGRAGKTDDAVRYYGELFDKYAEKNEAAKAIPLFRKLLQPTAQPPERYLRLGRLLQRSGKKDEATEAYRTALELFRKAGTGAGILEALTSLAELDPDHADTQVQLGEQATKAGKAELAAKAFLRAGQLRRPDSPDAALELLQRAYELAPERSVALTLSQIHLDKGNPQPAIELLLPLYSGKEQDPAVLDTLAAALLGAKRLAQAQEVLEALYKAKADSYERMFELADCFCKAGQAPKAVEVMQRVKERFFAAKRQKDFVERLEGLYNQNTDLTPLAEFAAAVFNEVNQENRYANVLGHLFPQYVAAKDYARAASALERLIDIDPYDFANPRRLEELTGKIDPGRFRAIAARITAAGGVASTPASAPAKADEAFQEAGVSDPQKRLSLLEDMIVQAEIFIQYSLKGKAVEKLQRIHQLFPGEESRNERLYKLFELAQYSPPGLKAPPPPGGAPVEVVAAAPPPAAAPETVSDLAKISEITHALYRQTNPKNVLHVAVSELGKYLRASRCLAALGRPGSPPSMAVEFCSPGVPQSPGAAIVKLLGLIAQQTLDPENGLVLDVNLTPDLKQVGAHSVLAMPLIDKEKQEAVGLIVLSQTDQERQWKPNEVYLLRTVADQAETAVSHTKLRTLVKTLSVADEATGLLGRGSYLDCVINEVNRARSAGTSVVVALLELDKGAALIRQFGEANMQKFMQQAGETLIASIRQNDIALRYTATCLAVVLGDTTVQKVRPVVEKLRKQLAGLKLPGGKDSISFSAGLSEAAVRPDYDPLDIVTDVINRAEFSVEDARKKGNTVAVR